MLYSTTKSYAPVRRHFSINLYVGKCEDNMFSINIKMFYLNTLYTDHKIETVEKYTNAILYMNTINLVINSIRIYVSTKPNQTSFMASIKAYSNKDNYLLTAKPPKRL